MSWRDYLDRIKNFEGYAPRASWDYKQHTNGYGTRARYPGEVITQEEAQKRFDDELTNANAFVKSLRTPMTDGQEAALTDLTFNAGPKWAGSGLGKAVRGGDWDTARERLQQYIRADGDVLPGLVNRRREAASWTTGAPQTSNLASSGASSGSVPPVLSSGYGRESFPGMSQPPQVAQASPQASPEVLPWAASQQGLNANGNGGSFAWWLPSNGTMGKAMGAFSGGLGGDDQKTQQTLQNLARAGQQANASALSDDEQRQARALQSVIQRRGARHGMV